MWIDIAHDIRSPQATIKGKLGWSQRTVGDSVHCIAKILLQRVR